MKMNDTDKSRLEDFIRLSVEYIERKSKQSNVNNDFVIDRYGFVTGTGSNPKDRKYRGNFLLDIDFQQQLLSSLLKMINDLRSNINTSLFGFAERPLYEYITTWVFLFAHPDVKPLHRRRASCLLLAGNFKFLEQNDVAYDKFLSINKKYLTPSNLTQLDRSKDGLEYYRYLWQVVRDFSNSYEFNVRHSFLKDYEISAIIGHQHMRVHANPLSIIETYSNTDKEVRHLLLVSYYLMQVVTYYRHDNARDYEKLNYRFQKFVKNHKITF